ncbi:MAG: hypothetical protein H6619_02420 [Deltaproteobacteria bacterium]|nr:hypothetical protein [Deltaproteobacteria bacterium]
MSFSTFYNEVIASVSQKLPLDKLSLSKITALDLTQLNITPLDFTFFVAIFGLLVALLALFRSGNQSVFNRVHQRGLQNRIDKVELGLADIKTTYTNALKTLEMDVRNIQHDVRELHKAMELILSGRENSLPKAKLETRRPTLDNIRVRHGEGFGIGLSETQERLVEGAD